MIRCENYIAEKIKSKVRDEIVLRSEINNPYFEEYINKVIEVIVEEIDVLIEQKICTAIENERRKLLSELRGRGIR